MMSQEPHSADSRDSTFAAEASALVDEVESRIRHDQPEKSPQRGPSVAPPITLGIVFLAVLGWNVVLLGEGANALSSVETQRAEGVLVFVATQAVEGFAAEHGRLPGTLAEAGIDAPGLTYSVRSDGYSIESVAEGAGVRFEQGQKVDSFLLGLGIAPPDAITPEPGG
jgi:hypothetical protein